MEEVNDGTVEKMENDDTIFIHKGQQVPITGVTGLDFLQEWIDKQRNWLAQEPRVVIVDGRPILARSGEKVEASSQAAPLTAPNSNSEVRPKTPAPPNARKSVMAELQSILDSHTRYKESGGIPDEGKKVIDFMERALFALGATKSRRKSASFPEIALEMLTNQDWYTSSRKAVVLITSLKNTAREDKYSSRVKIDNGNVTLLTEMPRYPHMSNAKTALDFDNEGTDAMPQESPHQNTHESGMADTTDDLHDTQDEVSEMTT